MEDSMIGGEDDDLEAILEECGAMIERPALNSNETSSIPTFSTRDQEGIRSDSRPQRPCSPQPLGSGNKLADSIDKLVSQNHQLLKLVAERQESPSEETRVPSNKRKVKEET